MFFAVCGVPASKALVKNLEARLGDLICLGDVPPANLGIDDFRGCHRKFAASSKWTTRKAAAKKRTKKMAKVAATIRK